MFLFFIKIRQPAGVMVLSEVGSPPHHGIKEVATPQCDLRPVRQRLPASNA
jgi:hypothetical protein